MNLLKFLHSFIPLINAHSNDFLVNDLWNNFIPVQIQIELNSLLNPEQILSNYINHCDRISQFESPKIVDSDLNWSSLIDPIDLTVNRTTTPNWSIIDCDLEKFIDFCARFSSFDLFSDVKDKFIDETFIDYHMTEKKSYEIERMSSLCRVICELYGIDTVIDIGSGKGYLGSDLSVLKGLDVIEIDSKQSNSNGALNRREKFNYRVPKLKSVQNSIGSCKPGVCKSIVRTITSTDSINTILIDEGIEKSDYLLTGLHCCGGLSSAILRDFVGNSESKAVVIVGCCYHLLSERFVKNFGTDSDNRMIDFPMSELLEKSGMFLGRNAKSFASQSVKRVLEEGGLSETVFHRVLLQELLKQKLGFVSDDWIVGKIGRKMNNVGDFEEFARISCEKLGLSSAINYMTSSDFQEFQMKYPRLRHEFTCFYYLKCCMAAIIENIIIYDRLVFMKENGITNAQVLELFDEIKSPRRYALVCAK